MKIMKLLITLVVLTVLSCSKDDASVTGPEVDVFIADQKGNVFKNGNKITFSGTINSDINVSVNKMTMSGNDIYLSGSLEFNTRQKPAYWKNGFTYKLDIAELTKGVVVASEVVGNDIYSIVNSVNFNGVQKGLIYKNQTFIVEVPTSITGNIIDLRGMKIANNKLYIAGIDTNASVINGKVWVYNLNDIAAGSIQRNGYDGMNLDSIDIEGNDIYVAGKINNLIVYIKNDTKTEIPNTQNTNLNCIKVNNNEIYIGGLEVLPINNNAVVAKYWKNGAGVEIFKSGGNGDNNSIHDMAFNGTDVYSVGEGVFGNGKNAIWKNTEIITVPDAHVNSFFNTIIVQPKN
jgi:hypothetical protein